MKWQKKTQKLFLLSISSIISLFVVNLIFLPIASIAGLFHGNKISRYILIIVAIVSSVFCGIICFKKLYRYLNTEIQDT